MYNEDVKNEYLDQLISSSVKRVAKSVFKNSEEYERYFNKDVCDFIEPEIIEYFTSMSATSFVGLHSRCSILRTYTQWCIDNRINKDNINHYDSIKPKDIDGCLNKIGEKNKYVTYEELRELAQEFTNVSDEALCYCLFFGIYGKKGEEIINITNDDISTVSNTVELSSGRKVYVPHEVAIILKESCNEYDYILPEDRRITTVPLMKDDPSVFKRRANARNNTIDSNNRRILGRLMKLRNETGSQALGVSRLKNSGLLEAIKNFSDNHPEYRKSLYDRQEIKDLYKKWNMTFPPVKKTFYNKIDQYI